MRSFFGWLFLAAAAALPACGGKVVVDGFGEGTGSGGAGGGMGGATSSSESASVSVSSSVSSSASSSAMSSSGSGMSCPDPFPGVEAHCDFEGQTCLAPLACCGGQVICKGGFWQYEGQLCQQDCTSQCGPNNFACVADAVCVAYIGKTTTYQCRKDPCNGMLSCGCAQMYCQEQMMNCNNIQDGYKVLCDCQGQC